MTTDSYSDATTAQQTLRRIRQLEIVVRETNIRLEQTLRQMRLLVFNAADKAAGRTVYVNVCMRADCQAPATFAIGSPHMTDIDDVYQHPDYAERQDKEGNHA